MLTQTPNSQRRLARVRETLRQFGSELFIRKSVKSVQDVQAILDAVEKTVNERLQAGCRKEALEYIARVRKTVLPDWPYMEANDRLRQMGMAVSNWSEGGRHLFMREYGPDHHPHYEHYPALNWKAVRPGRLSQIWHRAKDGQKTANELM